MDIEKVVLKLLADASSYNRVMDGVDARLRDFARRSESLTAIIAAPFAVATQAAMSLARALVESSTSAVQAAMGYEVLGMQLEVLAGNADKGQQLMRDLFQTAVETPFKVREVVAAAKEIKAFGFETDQVNSILKQLGDISAATGTPMHRLILAFGQTKIAGRLMGQEMRQFVNANVPMIENLAKVMGKPESQIKKMIENGQVGFDMVVRALNRMTGAGGQFELMMDRMSKTTQGRWNSFVETLEIVLAKAGGAFMKGFGLDKMFIDFRQWAEGLGNQLGDFEQLGRDVRDIWDGVVKTFVVVRNVIRFLITTIQEAWKAVEVWIDKHENLIKAIGFVIAVAVAWRAVILGITTALQILSTVMMILRGILISFALASFVVSLASIIAPLVTISGIVESLTAGLDIFISHFDEFGQRLASSFNQLVTGMSLTWKGMKDAFALGDMKLAFDILWAGIEYGFKVLVVRMEAEWFKLRKSLFDVEAGGVANDWKEFANLQAARVDAFLRLQNPLTKEEDKPGIRKALEDREKEIFQAHSKRQAEGAIIIQGQMDAILAKAEPEKRRLEALVKKAEQLREDASGSGKFSMLGMIKFHMEDLKAYEADFWKGMKELSNKKLAIKDFLDTFDAGRVLTPDMEALFRRYMKMTETTTPGGVVIQSQAAAVKKMKMDAAAFDEQQLFFQKGFEGRLQETWRRVFPEFGKLAIVMLHVATGMNETFDKIGEVLTNTKPNTSEIPYSISAAAKSYAADMQQKFMRGVGEETLRYDFFQNRMKLIEEARTGLTPEMQRLMSSPNAILRGMVSGIGVRNRAMDEDVAEYAMMDELDKLRKFVGDRTQMGPRAMLEGSSEAQETINRSQTQQTSVLESIRALLTTAQAMQAQQVEYQKQAVAALRMLAPPGPVAIAPEPRAVGFGVMDPPSFWR